MILQKGDTISGDVRGVPAKISCYGILANGDQVVYVIYPDGNVDRMVHRDGVLAYRPSRTSKRRDV